MSRSYIFAWMLILSGFAYGQDGSKDVTICYGTSLRLRAESVGAERYEWYHNNQVISGAEGSQLVVSENGKYRAVALIGEGCKSDASISIAVQYQIPLAGNDFAQGTKDADLVVDLLQNDLSVCSEINTASIIIKRFPIHGTLSVENGKVIYHPEPGFDALDSFSYTIKDANGLESVEATVSLNLTLPLPVTLISFNAQREEAVTHLTWKTTNETNSDRFDIERSSDGKSWYKIGETDAATESFEVISYTFTDPYPESGINYYRLKAVDLDNTFAYSKIQSVHFPEFAWAAIYPNPVSDILKISIRNKRVKKMRLINLSGQLVYSSVVQGMELQLSMKDLPLGIYFIHLEQDNGTVAVFKIMHD